MLLFEHMHSDKRGPLPVLGVDLGVIDLVVREENFVFSIAEGVFKDDLR